MKDSIFDLIEDKIPEGKKGYLEFSKNAPEPKDKSFFNAVKDYGKTILKGGIEGISRLGTVMSPTLEAYEKPITKQLEEQTEVLNELFPTDEGFTQRAIRRGLREAPTAMAFPGSAALQTLPRAMAAGFLGEGAKDLGAPEWAQTALELTAYIGPDITKKLLEKGSNAELIKEGKKLGLTDAQLTPLLQSDFKQKWLSKLTPRRGTTQKSLAESKAGLQEAYGKVQESFAAQHKLSNESSIKLISSIEDKLFEMPSGVREKITTDFHDLLNEPITGKSLINFWADINYEMGKTSKQLSLLKEPIKKALKETSPLLAKDFETVNALYSKYYPIAKKLEPHLYSDIMSASGAIGVLGGLVTGNYHLLATFVPPKILGKISQQMLINPRFQQLSHKMVLAMNQNKYAMAKKVADLMANEVRKTSPELAEQISTLSEEDFMNMLRNRPKQEEDK